MSDSKASRGSRPPANADAHAGARDADTPDAARLSVPRLAARLCWLLVGSLAVWGIVRATTLGYPLERDLWLARISGWTAAAALLLSLSMTPLGKLSTFLPTPRVPPALWPSLRRNLGITAAGAALVHATWSAFAFLDQSWSAIVAHPYLRAGLVTLCILVPLLLTSFPTITRGLQVWLWKPLHRLSYLAAITLLQHLLLSPFAPRKWVILIFAATLAIGLLRLLPARRRAPA